MFFAIACSGDRLSPEPLDDDGTVQVNLSFKSPGVATKGAATLGENKINKVTLLVFDNTGKRVVYQKFTSPVIGDITLPGKKRIDIYAIANSSYDFAPVTELKGFKETYSQFTSNSPDNFEMLGHVDTTLTKDGNLSIHLKRLASKIRFSTIKIHQLECCNTAACTNSTTHSIDEIYLTNVAATFPYSFEPSVPQSFLSVNKKNPLTYLQYSGSYSYAYETRENKRHTYFLYDTPMEFYCYPNPSSSTKTRVVLYVKGMKSYQTSTGEWRINFCNHYYSIKLPEMEPNTLYDIKELRIENSSFDKNANASNDRDIYFDLSYSMDVISLLDGKVLETIEGKGVKYEP